MFYTVIMSKYREEKLECSRFYSIEEAEEYIKENFEPRDFCEILVSLHEYQRLEYQIESMKKKIGQMVDQIVEQTEKICKN